MYGLSQCKLVTTPSEPHFYLHPATVEELAKLQSLGVNYQSAIGSINYLSTATRPNLSHAFSSLSQALESPGINHWNGFLHILRYLKGTQGLGLVYTQGDHCDIVGYSDVDWGNFRSTRRLVIGYLAQCCGNHILWKTRKQPSVSISTAEAEYKALCDLVSELLLAKSVSRLILSCSLLSIGVVGLGVRGDVENHNQDQFDQQNTTPSPTEATPPLLKN
ncbi:hypothetical protein O181_006970 [Austropuccinia psidii MF-1]|uniref:Reverse transcriptase Ty1/copia-type domain-containing protein n=1 Tax=Austropuccinia psidii MF-1 TaxID=1389203 RepID=A0A9Q3BLG5_9BASI|nr:hypothetical protein [Austropuccinia psidii MF-1]